MPIPRNPDGSQIVALRDLTLGIEKFVRSDNGTEQMAVNGSSTQAEDVWDGTGASDTGSDWTRGGTGSEQAAAKRSGTNGLNTGVTSKNDIWWFDYGSDRDLEASFQKGRNCAAALPRAVQPTSLERPPRLRTMCQTWIPAHGRE